VRSFGSGVTAVMNDPLSAVGALVFSAPLNFSRCQILALLDSPRTRLLVLGGRGASSGHLRFDFPKGKVKDFSLRAPRGVFPRNQREFPEHTRDREVWEETGLCTILDITWSDYTPFLHQYSVSGRGIKSVLFYIGWLRTPRNRLFSPTSCDAVGIPLYLSHEHLFAQWISPLDLRANLRRSGLRLLHEGAAVSSKHAVQVLDSLDGFLRDEHTVPRSNYPAALCINCGQDEASIVAVHSIRSTADEEDYGGDANLVCGHLCWCTSCVSINSIQSFSNSWGCPICSQPMSHLAMNTLHPRCTEVSRLD